MEPNPNALPESHSLPNNTVEFYNLPLEDKQKFPEGKETTIEPQIPQPPIPMTFTTPKAVMWGLGWGRVIRSERNCR